LTPLDLSRRYTFDAVANLYEEIRPGIPDQTVQDIIVLSGIPANGRIIEIGCGPGNATLSFARRGYEMLCLELGVHLAELAAKNCQHYPKVKIRNIAFEDWPLQERAFDLALSVEAFHWIPPEIGFPKVASSLKIGAALALVWHDPQKTEPALDEALDEVYLRKAPQLFELKKEDLSVEAWKAKIVGRYQASGCFGEVAIRAYPWSRRYTTSEYIKYLDTHSSHRILDDTTRKRLFDGIKQTIDQNGGCLERDFITHLYIARVV